MGMGCTDGYPHIGCACGSRMAVGLFYGYGICRGHLVLMLGVCLWYFMYLGVYFIAKKNTDNENGESIIYWVS